MFVFSDETIDEVLYRVIWENHSYRNKESIDECFKLQEECGVTEEEAKENFGNCEAMSCHKKCEELRNPKVE